MNPTTNSFNLSQETKSPWLSRMNENLTTKTSAPRPAHCIRWGVATIYLSIISAIHRLYKIEPLAESPPASSSRWPGVSCTVYRLGQTLLVSLDTLLLQEAGEEDHHVTHQGQVQALPLFLPSLTHHSMALSIFTARLTLAAGQVSFMRPFMVHLDGLNHL